MPRVSSANGLTAGGRKNDNRRIGTVQGKHREIRTRPRRIVAFQVGEHPDERSVRNHRTRFPAIDHGDPRAGRIRFRYLGDRPGDERSCSQLSGVPYAGCTYALLEGFQDQRGARTARRAAGVSIGDGGSDALTRLSDHCRTCTGHRGFVSGPAGHYRRVRHTGNIDPGHDHARNMVRAFAGRKTFSPDRDDHRRRRKRLPRRYSGLRHTQPYPPLRSRRHRQHTKRMADARTAGRFLEPDVRRVPFRLINHPRQAGRCDRPGIFRRCARGRTVPAPSRNNSSA